MKTNLYCVYDEKAKVYGQIFQLLNDDVAKRTLSPAVNNPEHNYGMFSEDYSLHKLGEYDDETGIIHNGTEAGNIEDNMHDYFVEKKICQLSELKQEVETK